MIDLAGRCIHVQVQPWALLLTRLALCGVLACPVMLTSHNHSPPKTWCEALQCLYVALLGLAQEFPDASMIVQHLGDVSISDLTEKPASVIDDRLAAVPSNQ